MEEDFVVSHAKQFKKKGGGVKGGKDTEENNVVNFTQYVDILSPVLQNGYSG